MSVQIVIMLSTLLILPLLAGALTLEHIRNDRRTPSRVRRPTLSVPE
jgi:hypothetical protein